MHFFANKCTYMKKIFDKWEMISLINGMLDCEDIISLS